MSDSISVEIDNQRINQVLQNLAARIEDMSPIMQHVSERMLMGVEQNFLTQGKNAGEMWEQLKKSTVKERDFLRFTPIKILTRTGALVTSISNNSDAHNAVVGTNSKYAAVHQFGIDETVSVGAHTRKVKGKTYKVKAFTRLMNIKARPFLVLGDKDKDAIIKIMEDELFKVL